MNPNMINVADPLPVTECPEPFGETLMGMLHKQQEDLITIDKMCQGIACSLMDAKITAVNVGDDINSISQLMNSNGALIVDIMNRLHLIITKIG